MLSCGFLLFSASTVTAEGRDWSVGYVLQTRDAGSIATAMPYRRYPSETFIDLMSRPFAPLAVSSVPAWYSANRDFRRPRPENVLPKAFRRPEQVYSKPTGQNV
jgi:hypothetical protein